MNNPNSISTEEHIKAVCQEIQDLLIEKNRSYGDSAVNPVRIFAKGLTAEQMIDVRIDDKLSRLLRGAVNVHSVSEDTEKDLMGYLILKRVVRRVIAEKQQEAALRPPVYRHPEQEFAHTSIPRGE